MKLDLLKDIYYNKEYISLYLKEEEEFFDFNYKEDGNIFVNKSIKRPIKNIGNIHVEDGYFDLESAYGYGGYYSNTGDRDFLNRAFSSYEKKCKEERIIAEFIRFHPFNNFPIKQAEFLDFNIYDRDVVIVDLEQDILKSYKAKVRNTVKRASEKVEFKESENIKAFVELYSKTMQKNNASDFYFFEDQLFQKLFIIEQVKLYEIVYEGNIVAMGFFMFGDVVAHYHLSANDDLSYKLNSNYVLLNSLFEIAKVKGLKYFMLGGGTTSAQDDSLLKYKKKFSHMTKPFYISGKIFNDEVYQKYISAWEEQTDSNIKYFLKYRLGI